MNTSHLAPTQPFSFDLTLAFLASFPPAQGEQTTSAGSLRKAFDVAGEPVLAEVSARGDALACSLAASRPLDARTREQVLDRVRFVLSLDDDLGPFYARAEQDRAFRPIVAARRGLHHPKFASAFEAAVWALLAQRTPIKSARVVKRALVERFGHTIEVGGEAYTAFPSAARLADASPAQIEAIVRHPQKSAAIVAAAAAFAGVDEAWLLRGPFDEVGRWLRAIPRIGPWSAAFVLFRGLGRMERIDLGIVDPIVACARNVYGSSADLERVAASYGADVGYWAFYLRASGGRSTAPQTPNAPLRSA
jgi:DNA-3-methyladenine glycosylase II